MAPRATRSRIAVGAAVLLLAAGTWISGLAERGDRPPKRAAVDFPSYPRQKERERIAARQTLPARPAAADARPDEDPVELRDPFLRSLPLGDRDAFVVLEANALRHSQLGELFVQCVLADHPDAFAEIARETGIDPLKDVDRVAYAGRAVVVSGFFDRVKWDALQTGTNARSTRYGDGATLWTTEGEGEAVASWRDQLVVVGPIADVRLAIDQVEGRAEPRRRDVTDGMAYGELYGVVPGSAARALLPAADGALAARLAAAAQRIELHVDSQDDVAGVIRVTGEPGPEVDDLAKALGAALSVARVKAAATDDAKLSALLENAQVVPGDGGFAVEVALPADVLREFFKDCGKRRAAPAE
jgi:hypothetical protein